MVCVDTLPEEREGITWCITDLSFTTESISVGSIAEGEENLNMDES